VELFSYLLNIRGLDIREGSTNDDFGTIIGLLKQIEKPNLQAIEIGCWKGSTTGAICTIVQRTGGILNCVDPWENETVNVDHSDILEIFENNMKKLNFLNSINIIRESSLTAHQHFEDESIDFCFIDGLHMYNYIHNDIKNFYPKIKKGGIICGHDLNIRYETLNKEQQEEIDNNIHVNCVLLKTVGRQVHCGVARAVYDFFGDDYFSSENQIIAVWWKFK